MGLIATSIGQSPRSVWEPAGVTRQPCGVIAVPSGCGPALRMTAAAAIPTTTTESTAAAAAALNACRCISRPSRRRTSFPDVRL